MNRQQEINEMLAQLRKLNEALNRLEIHRRLLQEDIIVLGVKETGGPLAAPPVSRPPDNEADL